MANELGDPIIDLPEMIQQRGIQNSDYLSEDGVHLSVRGNRIYADLVFERLCEILD